MISFRPLSDVDRVSLELAQIKIDLAVGPNKVVESTKRAALEARIKRHMEIPALATLDLDKGAFVITSDEIGVIS